MGEKDEISQRRASDGDSSSLRNEKRLAETHINSIHSITEFN